VDAVNRCAMTIEIEVDWGLAIKSLSELNSHFASQVQALVK
jgi:hypothetical protein